VRTSNGSIVYCIINVLILLYSFHAQQAIEYGNTEPRLGSAELP
jgi:hypothetical protein